MARPSSRKLRFVALVALRIREPELARHLSALELGAVLMALDPVIYGLRRGRVEKNLPMVH